MNLLVQAAQILSFKTASPGMISFSKMVGPNYADDIGKQQESRFCVSNGSLFPSEFDLGLYPLAYDGFKEKGYAERLPTLAFRRLRGDMIEMYKMISGRTYLHSHLISSSLLLTTDCTTRGHEKNYILV